MEVSQYCDLVKNDTGRWIVFCTATGKSCVVNDDVYHAIKSEKLSELSLGEKARLSQLGILVDSRAEEQQRVHEQLNGYRDNSDVLRYTLVTTYACNLRCTYCYEDAMDSRRGVMSDAVAEQVLAKVKRDLAASKAKHVGITLYGGEPLLNLGPAYHVLSELGKYQRKANFVLHGAAITNGTLFTEKNVPEYAKHIQNTQLTLDGGPSFHNTIRKLHDGQPTFERICRSAQLLTEHGVQVMMRIQVCEQSVPSLELCFQKLKEFGLLHNKMVQIYFFPILDVRDVCSSKAFRCGSEYYEPRLFQHLWPYGQEYGVLVTTPPVPVWFSPYCSFVNRWACLIDPEGAIYKCVADVGKPECVIGSTLNDDGAQTKTQKACEKRFLTHQGLAFSKCKKCSYLPLCDGGCAHFAHRGGSSKKDGPSCELHLRAIKAWLQQPSTIRPLVAAESPKVDPPSSSESRPKKKIRVKRSIT
jgi:uncharacterized protein